MSGLNYCPRLTWTYVSYVFDQLPGVVAQVPKFKSWRSKEGTPFKDPVSRYNFNKLAPVIQKVDNAIHWINRYPVENAVGFPNTYPLDTDFSGGQCYPTLKQPGPGESTTSSVLAKNRRKGKGCEKLTKFCSVFVASRAGNESKSCEAKRLVNHYINLFNLVRASSLTHILFQVELCC